MIPNLKRNWHVSSNLTWGILQILTQELENLKNLLFNMFHLTKVYIVSAKKRMGELCLMALYFYATFEGKMTCSFKNQLMNLTNFYHSMLRSLKIGTLMRSFYWKWKLFELKCYMGVLRHDSEEWCKIWRGIDSSVQNWHEEFDKFWPSQKFAL